MIMISILLYDCILVNVLHITKDQSYHSILPHLFIPAVLSQIAEHKCSQIGKCKVTEDFILPVCYCDSACIDYNDCCYDASLSDNLTSASSLHEKKEFMSCNDKTFGSNFVGLWMVTKCPQSLIMHDISDRCNVEENIHPVSADDGTVYRNAYCAMCHNVTNVTPWRFEFSYKGHCSTHKMNSLNVTISQKIRYAIENRCKYSFIPSLNSKIRSCFNTANSYGFNQALCSNFQNPVVIDQNIYKNAYCVNRTGICYGNYVKKVDGFHGLKGHGMLLLTGIFNIYPVIDWFGSKRCYNNKHYYDVNMVSRE